MNPLEATRAAGESRLAQFLPHAGADYTDWRNHDFGPNGDNRVSGLSPWLRHRLLTEEEVIDAAARAHGLTGAEKFIQEVCWRSYWKGYLERRPVHWHDYRKTLDEALTGIAKDKRQNQLLLNALEGNTGIECFDAWVDELIQTGYLHNHARMWFASIWVFTLGLPWAIGADFFLRHLLDGDPASNTLSWRWVAGHHTAGKTYLARPSNIARYTNGRFNPVDSLAAEAPAPPASDRPPLQPIPDEPDFELTETTGLLITEDDLHPESCFDERHWPLVMSLQTTGWRSPLSVSAHVQGFVADALVDAMARNPGVQALGPIDLVDTAASDRLVEPLQTAGIRTLVTPWVPAGPTADALAAVEPILSAAGIRLVKVPREWDVTVWPHATHGFFRFWKAVGPMLSERYAAFEA